MKKILIVEDEQNIRAFEVINLQRAGYTAVEAESAEEALMLYDTDPESFDIALLDIAMPGMDGLELCKRLRARSTDLGIIMLTARTQEMDKISGLMYGADDYITKPFSPSELSARVDALYRRVEMQRRKTAGPVMPDEITLGDFTMNTRRRSLKRLGRTLDLTQVEYQIMEYLFLHHDTGVKRTDILNYVWGEDYDGEDKIVDVNMRRLRMKIEAEPSRPQHLLTVWGVGYQWRTAEQ